MERKQLCEEEKTFQGSGTSDSLKELAPSDFDRKPGITKAYSASEANITLADFEMLKLLGKGSYGKVLLVRKKGTSNQLYAMKVLKKSELVARNQVNNTKTERNILASVNHPNVVKLKFAFQTFRKLYLVLEFCSGGELFFHLHQATRFGEKKARFYAANVVLAFEHFHKQNIMYRE